MFNQIFCDPAGVLKMSGGLGLSRAERLAWATFGAAGWPQHQNRPGRLKKPCARGPSPLAPLGRSQIYP